METKTMKYAISGDCKTITIFKENGFYQIKEEENRYYIYCKYDGDDTLYYIESFDKLGQALQRVGLNI